ncbi:MAG: hypothetical protein JWM19_2990 [Actinomycetia bacterium]|nr:hypothetical protein [Actinomycetes bacterium]
MNLERTGERALLAAVCMPVGPAGRMLLWSVYDYYMEELRFRAGTAIMARMVTR